MQLEHRPRTYILARERTRVEHAHIRTRTADALNARLYEYGQYTKSQSSGLRTFHGAFRGHAEQPVQRTKEPRLGDDEHYAGDHQGLE